MKSLEKLGLGLLAAGVILVVYGSFKEFIREFFTNEKVPLFFKIGFSVVILGLLIMIVALVIERFNDKKKENDYINNGTNSR